MKDLDIINILKDHGGLGSVPLARTIYELRRQDEENRAAIRALWAAAYRHWPSEMYEKWKREKWHAAAIARAEGKL
jgi:hypothetical protein